MNHPTIFIFEKSFNLVNYLIKKFLFIAQESIEKRGQFTVAFSGGKTPVEFYTRLSGFNDEKIWDKTHIFQTDERFVLPESPNSNWGMIKNNFLSFVDIPARNLYPIDTQLSDVKKSAQVYENTIKSFFKVKQNEMPVFDLVFLGMGEDGHIASLFPAEKSLNEKARLTVDVSSHYVRYERISLTFPVINHARYVILLVKGKNKSEAVSKVLIEKSDLPATRVEPVDGELIYLLDKEAASQLSYQDSHIHDGEAIVITRT